MLLCDTEIDEFVQLLLAEIHIVVGAELHAVVSQDIQDLLPDGLQSLRVAHQVVRGPEGGRERVPH